MAVRTRRSPTDPERRAGLQSYAARRFLNLGRRWPQDDQQEIGVPP